MRGKINLGDVIISKSCYSSGLKGIVNHVYFDDLEFTANMDNGIVEWFDFSDQGDDWDFAEDQRLPDPYTGPARPPKPAAYPDFNDVFTKETPPTPPEAPEYVYKGVKTHDLVLTIPEGTKRLEGEFEGYKVILEKL